MTATASVKKKTKRDYTTQMRARKCAVCGKNCKSTIEMRSHECTANYHRRMGYVWSPKHKKYMDPVKLVTTK